MPVLNTNSDALSLPPLQAVGGAVALRQRHQSQRSKRAPLAAESAAGGGVGAAHSSGQTDGSGVALAVAGGHTEPVTAASRVAR